MEDRQVHRGASPIKRNTRQCKPSKGKEKISPKIILYFQISIDLFSIMPDISKILKEKSNIERDSVMNKYNIIISILK